MVVFITHTHARVYGNAFFVLIIEHEFTTLRLQTHDAHNTTVTDSKSKPGIQQTHTTHTHTHTNKHKHTHAHKHL